MNGVVWVVGLGSDGDGSSVCGVVEERCGWCGWGAMWVVVKLAVWLGAM